MMVWSSCCCYLSILWLRHALAVGILELAPTHAFDQAGDATMSFFSSSFGTRAVLEAEMWLLLLW